MRRAQSEFATSWPHFIITGFVAAVTRAIIVCYYHLLAVHLPNSRLRDQLLDIVEDKRPHLYFHCDFLRSQTEKGWQKRIFFLVWRLVMACAALVVAIDHRAAIRDMKIGLQPVLARWRSYSELAEALVIADSAILTPTCGLTISPQQ